MRLTVGPLPPAVYWRRRAVVFGAGLLFLVVLLYSCSGPGNSGAASEQTKSPTPPAGAGPTDSVRTPETGAPPESEPADQPLADQPRADQPADSPTTATVPSAPPPGAGACTDAEIRLTPVPSSTSVKRGVTIELRFKIKNVSKRTCSRDVGAGPQELFIKRGASVIWSSDVCDTARDSNVQSFPPSIEHEYWVTWNGRDSTKCAGESANGPYPEPGDYQLFGRLGTKLSEPVKITITG